MRDLKTFREKIEAYRKNAPTPHTQKELAEAIPLDKDELSKRLNAYRRPERTSSPLSCAQVQAIVRILARWGAIETQEQAKDLLDLMECPYFSSSDWKTHPLNLLRSTPISTIRLPSIPANTDKQRKELGLLEERNPSHLRILTLEEMVALSRKYLAVLTERNKMLDFKGIRQVGFKQSSSMPLVEIFVPPDVLIGIPDYETLERGYIEKRFAGRKKQYTAYNRDGQEGQTPQEEINWREIQAPFQREKFSSVLQKQHRLVILGDPGSGKSVLLQYLLLQLAQGQDAPVSASTPPPSTIPLYLPLAAYAEAYSLSSSGSHSLEDFLPVYLREMYLEDFALLLKYSLQQGKALLLLDGLDEISDATLRMKVVRQIELFTQTYAQNGFLVTSRIVGYREAPLAAGYTVYTLADFNEEQIKSFSQKWCLAYARWVRDLPESTTLQQLTTNEAEQLFEAAQSEPAIRKLAINPLLLTIFALFNHKETKFPSHRVELFELCATTLLDTWGKARGQSFTSHRNNPMRILRTLAFWMHEHRTVGVVPEEMLLEWVTDQLLVQGITRYKDQALQMAEEFLELVRGKTGILVERGRRRYGFLHQTFEEYFAARELALRKDRNEFIRTHLHEAHWREVILLAIGIVGIFEDEAAVTGILQDTILCAGSPFEKWLHRDLLFAGMCLADNVEVRAACEEDIIERIVYLYLTSPYYSLREACSEVLLAWRGTPTAMKASQLILNLLRKRETGSSTLMRVPRPGSLTFEEKWAGYQKQLFHQYSQARLQLLRLGMISVLSHCQVEVAEQIASVLQLVTQPNVTVREAAAEVLGQIGKGQPMVVEALLGLLGDVDSNVRKAAAHVLGQVGKGQPRVSDALLSSLTDTELEVRKVAAEALGQIGEEKPSVVEALLGLLGDVDSDVRGFAVQALGQVGKGQQAVIEALLNLLSDRDSDLRSDVIIALGQVGEGHIPVSEALLDLLATTLSHSSRSPYHEVLLLMIIAEALGRTARGEPSVIEALLTLLSHPEVVVRYHAAQILGQVDSGRPVVLQALRQLLKDPDSFIRQAAAKALGRLGRGQSTVIQAVRKLLEDSDASVRRAAAEALGQLGKGGPSVIQAVRRLLRDPDTSVRCAAAQTLGQLADGELTAINALLPLLTDPNERVRQAAVHAFGRPSMIRALLRKEVGPFADEAPTDALEYICLMYPRMIEAFLFLLDELDLREVILESLVQVSRQSNLIEILVMYISSHDYSYSYIRQAAAKTLVHMSNRRPELIKHSYDLLCDDRSDVRATMAQALGQTCSLYPHITHHFIDTLAKISSGDTLPGINLTPEPENGNTFIEKVLLFRQLSFLKEVGCEHPEALEVLRPILGTVSTTFNPYSPGIDMLIANTIIRVLGQLGSNAFSVIEILLPYFTSEDFQINIAAAEALEEMGKKQPAVIDALLPFLSSPDPHTRSRTVSTLGRLSSNRPTVIDALLPLLSDRDANVRVAVVRALGQLGSEKAGVLEALQPWLLDSAAVVRRATAEVLQRVGKRDELVIEMLLSHLHDRELEVRRAAVEGLGRLGGGQPAIIEALLPLLSDSDVRQAAIEALGNYGREQPLITEALLAYLSDSNFHVRRAIATVLGRFDVGKPPAIEALLTLLVDSKSEVRQEAALSLGKTGKGQPFVIDALVARLSDFNAKVRQAAAIALGQVGAEQPAVIEALFHLFSDLDANVRRTTGQALTALPLDHIAFGRRIEALLQVHEAPTDLQLSADNKIDALLFALQRIVSDV